MPAKKKRKTAGGGEGKEKAVDNGGLGEEDDAGGGNPNTSPRFDDEPKQPPLGNLATHLKTHGGPSISIPGATRLGDIRGVSAASAKIMADFLREGQLNPAVNPTQKGFAKVIAAWILEDDLPFTTGETGGIRRLFKYIQSNFVLPSNATVRNTLARIFVEMFEKLKADLKISVSSDTWTTCSMTFMEIKD
ncbi:hypothetical protein B0H14DRAFT_3434881 [Mycena olivaceomarginata]|nr:hypothetical protein B0H14DRAFT_3434881 [Mycena olivaceomarginata]